MTPTSTKGEQMPDANRQVHDKSGMVDAVKQLADYHAKSPALIVRTPEGGYLISPDGMGEGTQNTFVISRSQLATLMWEHGLRREALADPQTAAKVTALVAAFCPPGPVSRHQGDRGDPSPAQGPGVRSAASDGGAPGSESHLTRQGGDRLPR